MNRHNLLTLLIAFAAVTFTDQKVLAQRKVIFVCEHGAAKSVIAAEYFNKLAVERGLKWEAICRGTFPDSTVSTATAKGLWADGLLKTKVVPTKLSEADSKNVEHIVLFTPVPKNYTSGMIVHDWSNVTNIDGPYELRREAIIRQLKILLDSLEKE